MRTLLTTVGTSLLGNAKRDLGAAQPNDQQFANYLRQSDPVRASAETNSLSRLLQDGDKVVFLHSQTEDGRRCAEHLCRYFDGQGYAASIHEVADLSYAESRFKMRGLRSLVATLISLIRKERAGGREVLVNATGGFKAEIAYATLVGLLFDVPVYYIHEAFQDIIQMPPTPIGWDYTLLADHEKFFEWIDEDLRPTAETDQRLRDLPADVRLLLSEEEGYTLLSPTGEAFYEAYRDRVAAAAGVPLFLSANARKTYEGAEPQVQVLYARTLQKLRVPELRRGGSEVVGDQAGCLL